MYGEKRVVVADGNALGEVLVVADAAEAVRTAELRAAGVVQELGERGLLHPLDVAQGPVPPVHLHPRRGPEGVAHHARIRRGDERSVLHARARIRGAA